ncbi:hypothetical protein K2173_021071 [Erythroxylum novogranatense]|uniref:Cytochrome P450 n=1 Tax=Erythroxylum novogranatense TaxID=1862640 RepID=A0AAV8TMI2_9ROSI|nr:hypothetical protein K2173_021071 [Erythroxylum novogranatense]
MELLSFFHIPFISLVIAFIILRACTKSRTSSSFTSIKVPPGPWRLPIIGNLHQLAGHLPHHILTQLAQKYGPIMHLQLGEVSTIVISSAELAKEVMKNQDSVFATRPYVFCMSILTYGYKNVALAPYGEYWRQLKKLYILELLSGKRVQLFRSVRGDEISNLVKTISSKVESSSVINLTKMATDLTLNITSRTAFGKIRDRQAVVRVIKGIGEMTEGFSFLDVFPSIKPLHLITRERSKLLRVQRELDITLEKVINECRVRKDSSTEADRECIIDALFEVEDQGKITPFSQDHIKAIMVDIFGGGIETSSVVLQWAMSEMLKNPRTMERAQAEIREAFDQVGQIDESNLHQLKYLKSVIKETLRLHPPLPLLLPRENSEKVEINGYEIPIKTRIIVSAYAIGRDPNYWTEAERFCPERFVDSAVDYKGTDFEFIPFGAGRRICPGIQTGIAIVELALANLLYHFDWKLPNGLNSENLDMSEARGLTAHRKNDLCLVPSLHYL